MRPIRVPIGSIGQGGTPGVIPNFENLVACERAAGENSIG